MKRLPGSATLLKAPCKAKQAQTTFETRGSPVHMMAGIAVYDRNEDKLSQRTCRKYVFRIPWLFKVSLRMR